MTTTSIPQSPEAIELAPSYRIPIALFLMGIPLAFIQIWVGGVVALFGIFLLFQTVTLRLRFTETDLDVYRGETLIRRFPYQDWQNWEIFWAKVPILFYFREVKSIHFLPMLFSASQLRACLEQRFPKVNP
ncbi:MAG: DUF3119 family protein [Leptolyngbyaceae cyanobacterium bins.59]|nr:DUF3119 family protein [Leptolyngbyaceae cyanobacterium bins.59]